MRTPTSWLLLCLAAIFVTVPAGAAQPPPPSRNGNVYGGFDHQPTQAEVQRREHRAGVAPDAAEQAKQNSTVEHIYQELMQGARTN